MDAPSMRILPNKESASPPTTTRSQQTSSVIFVSTDRLGFIVFRVSVFFCYLERRRRRRDHTKKSTKTHASHTPFSRDFETNETKKTTTTEKTRSLPIVKTSFFFRVLVF